MPTPRAADAFAKRSLCRSVPEVLWITEDDGNFSLVRQTRNSRAEPVAITTAGCLVCGLRRPEDDKTSRWRHETAGANSCKVVWRFGTWLAIVARDVRTACQANLWLPNSASTTMRTQPPPGRLRWCHRVVAPVRTRRAGP